MRSAAAALLVAAGLALSTLALAGPGPGAPARPGDDRAATLRELDAARKTEALVAEKLAAREKDLSARVRALYKLTRSGLAPLWLEKDARGELVRRRAAARRLIERDLEERALLREELDRARRQRERLEEELAVLDRALTPAPPPGALAAPVAGRRLDGFGVARDPKSGARLARTGLSFAARPGQAVVAPAAGTIRYAGPVRGLGQGVVIELAPDLYAVVAGLSGIEVDAGASVAAGTRLGAAHPRVTLQLYRAGRPIDPAPSLAP
jgi:septal ring factor EnvC (AmiA/AmiB activator)